MPDVRQLVSYGYLGLVLVFLYLPILVMMAMAFNSSALYELPFTFDLVWFEALVQNERLLARRPQQRTAWRWRATPCSRRPRHDGGARLRALQLPRPGRAADSAASRRSPCRG